MESTYKNLNKISVADKVEKKGRFDYLSWAWAWHYLKQEYPNANRVVYENENGVPYFSDGQFANVKVGIIVNDIEHIDYLTITDNLNRLIPLTKITSFDVNNAIQRSTAKAIAMHGLGLSLWIGEDTARIPNQVKQQPQSVTYTLRVGDDNWDKVMTYIVKHKAKGLEWIIKQLSTKYKISTQVKTKINKVISE